MSYYPHRGLPQRPRIPSPRTSDGTYRKARASVLAASDICWLCGSPGADTVDHLIPHSEGGSDHPDNLRPAHDVCNKRRGTRAADSVNFRPSTSFEW